MIFTCPFTPAVTAITNLISTLTGWFGEADNQLHLMQNNPAITPGMVVGDIVEADFGGYAALPCPDGVSRYIDVATGKILLFVRGEEGARIWRPSSLTNLPQTIYGVYLTDVGGTKLMGVGKLLDPVTFTETNQGLALPDIQLEVPPKPIG